MLQDQSSFLCCLLERLRSLIASKAFLFACRYVNKADAWVAATLFHTWFHGHFVPSVQKAWEEKGLDKRAILLIDNCSAHATEEELTPSDGKTTVWISDYYLMKTAWYWKNWWSATCIAMYQDN